VELATPCSVHCGLVLHTTVRSSAGAGSRLMAAIRRAYVPVASAETPAHYARVAKARMFLSVAVLAVAVGVAAAVAVAIHARHAERNWDPERRT
jgi:hypothetical protein